MSSRYPIALIAVLTATIATPLLAQAPDAPPPGEGLELIERSCINCHDIYMITSKRKTPQEWAATLGVMVDRGADVTPEEMQVIEEYLSQHYAADAANANAH
ncbi:MAG TPA: hypothetical protein VFR96_14080 [Povalibacter sp.]|jgi:hypothetical protein|nr:hypothetical protein [Povalibacter sp.]